MCLILFAYKTHPRYPLILVANRDEFYARPTAPAAFWTDAPTLFAGRDLAAGGTWLGITKTGRFAAVTNYRDPFAPVGEKSRGHLTKNFLLGDELPADYLRHVEYEQENYSGFNLLVGDFGADRSEFFYFSNRDGAPRELSAGIYGLSNALLDTAWYKVETSKAKFAEVLQTENEIAPAVLLPVLADQTLATDEKLPTTGISRERECLLSPAFIKTDDYGTRSTTVLLIERDGRINFTEKTFVGTVGEVYQEFALPKILSR